MRTLIITLFLLAAFFAGLTIFSGIQTEKLYNQTVNLIEAEGYNVLSSRFERGFFHSFAKAEFDLGNSLSSTMTLVIEHEFTHGPFPLMDGIFDDTGSFKFLAAYIKSNLTLLIASEEGFSKKGFPPIVAITSMDYLGHGQTLVNQKGSKFVLENSASLTWGGLAGEMNFNRDFSSISFNFLAPTLMFQNGEEAVLELSGLKLMARLKNNNKGYARYLGNSSFSIESTNFVFPSDVTIAIDGLRTNSSSNIKNRQLDFVYELKFNELGWNEDSYGPATVEVRLFNLDSTTLENLIESLMEDKNLIDDEDEVLRFIDEFATHSPGIEVKNLKLNTELGSIKGYLKIQVSPLYGSDDRGQKGLINNSIANASLEIPRQLFLTLIKKYLSDTVYNELNVSDEGRGADIGQELDTLAQENLKSLIAEKVFVTDGDKLRVEMEMIKGELNLNGRRLTQY